MIYKIVLIIVSLCFITSSFAAEHASVSYDKYFTDYSKLNGDEILKEADDFFEQFETTGDTKYLTTAMAKYYILSKIFPLDIYTNIQLARTYDASNKDRYAKEYFNKSCDINKFDPYANYYFGEFYFKRNDYKRALKYYKTAYNNGYSEYYDLNLRIATIYEKFADLLSAKYYYERAYNLNPADNNSKDKILRIDSLNYDKSEYYN